MANSLLTIDMITRKSLEILENNLVLSRNVNKEYDDSFAVEGAKIGSTLRIRLPDRALVTDGAALQVQEKLGPEAVVVTIFCDDNKKYLSTDLLRTEPVKAGYYSPDIELICYEAFKRAR